MKRSLKYIALTSKQPTEKYLVNDDALILSEHQEIVLDRIAKAKANPERLIDWEKASKILQS